MKTVETTRIARRLSTALRATQFYPPGHDRVHASLERLTADATELFASDGAFSIELDGGQIVGNDSPADQLALGVLAGEMQRRGIRAIEFHSPPDAVELERLVTLLGEPPLELEGRGGAVSVSSSFATMALVAYRYEIDTDATGDAAPDEASQWSIRSEEGSSRAVSSLTVDDLEEIPGVVEEMGRLRESLAADHETSDTDSIVRGVMQIALGRLAGPEGAGSGALPRPPERREVRETGDEEIGPLHAIADRIYGIVLSHLMSQSRDGGTDWEAGEGDVGLYPVDPKRLLQTRNLLSTELASPPDEKGGALDMDQTWDVSEVAVGLLAGDADRPTRDACLNRLRGALSETDENEAPLERIGRLVTLLYSHALPAMTLIEILGAIKRATEITDLSRALLERMPNYVGAHAKMVAEKIDLMTLKHVVEEYLRGSPEARSSALGFLRATPDRVVQVLTTESENADEKLRRQMVALAREIEGPGVPKLLARLAKDEDRHVCLSALRALVCRPDDESLRLFEEALIEAQPSVWRPLTQTATGPGTMRIPPLLDRIVRGEEDLKRPLRDRLEALRALDRVRGMAGRERVVKLTRFFSLREPAASILIRREARRQLKTAPATGTVGDEP